MPFATSPHNQPPDREILRRIPVVLVCATRRPATRPTSVSPISRTACHRAPCSTMPLWADGGLLPFLRREVAYGYLDRASGVYPGDLRGHQTREVASEVTGRWKEKGRPLREGAALHHITRTYVKQPPGATGDRLPCILRQKTRRGNPLAASRRLFEGPKELACGYL